MRILVHGKKQGRTSVSYTHLDVRFAEHSGIDAYALTRAIVKRGILMQKNAGGGSTITQQPVSYTHLDVYKRQEI